MEIVFCVLKILANPQLKQRWRVQKFGMMKGQSGIIFHVQGCKFTGWVKVQVDADSIQHDISFLENDGKAIDERKQVWIMELAKTIDDYIQNGSDGIREPNRGSCT
jgi:hypothetical protein